jgi:hypothetical protein
MFAARRLLLFACWAAVAVHAQDDVVDWRDAARCVGRQCGLRGTVVATEPSGPTIRLFFDAGDHSVRVILMRGWLVDWPPYVGRTIIANGKVQRFRDHVEMIVLDPSDIAVIDGEPDATSTAPLPPTAPSPTAPATIAPPTIEPSTAAPSPAVPPIVAPPPVVPPPMAAPVAASPAAPPTETAPAPSPPAAAVPTPTSSEVEQLRQRVRELEQRIEQLEGR